MTQPEETEKSSYGNFRQPISNGETFNSALNRFKVDFMDKNNNKETYNTLKESMNLEPKIAESKIILQEKEINPETKSEENTKETSIGHVEIISKVIDVDQNLKNTVNNTNTSNMVEESKNKKESLEPEPTIRRRGSIKTEETPTVVKKTWSRRRKTNVSQDNSTIISNSLNTEETPKVVKKTWSRQRKTNKSSLDDNISASSPVKKTKGRRRRSMNDKTVIGDSETLIGQLHAQNSPIKRLKRGRNKKVQPSLPDKVEDVYIESEESKDTVIDEFREDDDRIDLHINENREEEDLGFCYKAPKKKLWWTEAETNALIEGVKRFGRGKWKKILDEYIEIFQTRRKARDLSDRMRIVDKRSSLYVFPDTVYTEIDENHEPVRNKDGTPKTFICKFPHEAALMAASDLSLFGKDDIVRMGCDDANGKAVHIYRVLKGFNGRRRVRKISGKSGKRVDGW